MRAGKRGISIHAPAKGATHHFRQELHMLYISIHAPAKGATSWGGYWYWDEEKFQSTLPRRERLLTQKYAAGTITISIHAPAKGATSAVKDFFASGFISIHAPAKGATRISRNLAVRKEISIHAPAKGATKRGIKVKRAG